MIKIKSPKSGPQQRKYSKDRPTRQFKVWTHIPIYLNIQTTSHKYIFTSYPFSHPCLSFFCFSSPWYFPWCFHVLSWWHLRNSWTSYLLIPLKHFAHAHHWLLQFWLVMTHSQHCYSPWTANTAYSWRALLLVVLKEFSYIVPQFERDSQSLHHHWKKGKKKRLMTKEPSQNCNVTILNLKLVIGHRTKEIVLEKRKLLMTNLVANAEKSCFISSSKFTTSSTSFLSSRLTGFSDKLPCIPWLKPSIQIFKSS